MGLRWLKMVKFSFLHLLPPISSKSSFHEDLQDFDQLAGACPSLAEDLSGCRSCLCDFVHSPLLWIQALDPQEGSFPLQACQIELQQAALLALSCTSLASQKDLKIRRFTLGR